MAITIMTSLFVVGNILAINPETAFVLQTMEWIRESSVGRGNDLDLQRRGALHYHRVSLVTSGHLNWTHSRAYMHTDACNHPPNLQVNARTPTIP